MPMTLTRSFFAIILPGLVLVGPWLLLLILSQPEVGKMYVTYPAPSQVCAFAAVVLLGAIVEAVGMYVEKRWDDLAALVPKPSDDESWLEEDWYDYLSRSFDNREPVGYRYLSRKVTELYFELGMMVAGPIGAVGLLWILRGRTSSALGCVAFATVPLILYLFYRFAKDTHSVLCETRYRINRRLRREG